MRHDSIRSMPTNIPYSSVAERYMPSLDNFEKGVATGMLRREFLKSAIGGAVAVVPARMVAQSYDPRSDYAATQRKLFLFLDWFHVQKGDLLVSLDPQQISPEGSKLLEVYKRDFNKEFDQSGHGYRRSN